MEPEAREWWAVNTITTQRTAPRLFMHVWSTGHSTSLCLCKDHEGNTRQALQHHTPNRTAFKMLAPSTLGEW